jgi:hypothetical protein
MVRSYAQIQADSGLGDCVSTKWTPAHLERIGVVSAPTFSSTHGMFPHCVSFGMLSEGLFHICVGLSIKSTLIAGVRWARYGQLFFFLMQGGGLSLGP